MSPEAVKDLHEAMECWFAEVRAFKGTIGLYQDGYLSDVEFFRGIENFLGAKSRFLEGHQRYLEAQLSQKS